MSKNLPLRQKSRENLALGDTARKNFEFFQFTNDLQKEWDDFVIANKRGSIHQVSDFKKLQEKIPGRGPVLGFGVRDKKSREILATVFCVKMQTGFLSKFWWYSARGPVFNDGAEEAVKFLLKKSRDFLQKQEKGLFWRLDPYLELQDADIFAGFSTKLAT